VVGIGVVTSVVLAVSRGSDDVPRSVFETLLTAVFAGFTLSPAATIAALAAMMAASVPAGMASETLIALAIATGFTARTASIRLVVIFVAILLLSVPAAVVSAATTDLTTIVIYLLLATVSGAIGLMLRFARGREQRLAEQLTRRSLAEQEIRQSERLTIADELHDVVARELTVIVMQTELITLRQNPTHVRDATQTIRESARKALSDLHRLVGRVNDERITDGIETLHAALSDAQTELRRGGHPVTVTAQFDLATLPRLIDTTLARMVREAATNILKHGAAGAVTIDLSEANGRVRLDVRNPVGQGRLAPPLPSSGFGQVRMGERAALLGGTFTSHRDAETWLTRADLPIR